MDPNGLADDALPAREGDFSASKASGPVSCAPASAGELVAILDQHLGSLHDPDEWVRLATVCRDIVRSVSALDFEQCMEVCGWVGHGHGEFDLGTSIEGLRHVVAAAVCLELPWPENTGVPWVAFVNIANAFQLTGFNEVGPRVVEISEALCALGMEAGRALAIGALGAQCLDEDSVRGIARVANDPDIQALALMQPGLDDSLRDELAVPIIAEAPAGSLIPADHAFGIVCGWSTNSWAHRERILECALVDSVAAPEALHYVFANEALVSALSEYDDEMPYDEGPEFWGDPGDWPDETVAAAATSRWVRARAFVAMWDDVPAAILQRLALDSDPEIRALVSANLSATDEIRAMCVLASDADCRASLPAQSSDSAVGVPVVEGPVEERPNSELTDEELIRKADGGDAEAVKDVGVRAEQAGHLQKARLWYERAAALGHAGAVRNLGVLAENAGEFSVAESSFREAFAMGDTRAAANLVIFFIEQDRDAEAREWLEVSGECGELSAFLMGGYGYLERGERDKAFALWRSGAKLGELPMGDQIAGYLYELGEADEAENWARAGASKGSVDCMRVMAYLARDRADRDEARAWFQAAADLGDSASAFSRGELSLQDGDLETAAYWWIKAANMGNGAGAYNAGQHFKSEGDLESAAAMFQRSAELGHPEGMNNHAVCLRIAGNDEADFWYQRAAESGSAVAMRNLGDRALKDNRPDEARAWFERAAAAGETRMDERIGEVNRP